MGNQKANPSCSLSLQEKKTGRSGYAAEWAERDVIAPEIPGCSSAWSLASGRGTKIGGRAPIAGESQRQGPTSSMGAGRGLSPLLSCLHPLSGGEGGTRLRAFRESASREQVEKKKLHKIRANDYTRALFVTFLLCCASFGYCLPAQFRRNFMNIPETLSGQPRQWR